MHISDIRRRFRDVQRNRIGPAGLHVGFILEPPRLQVADPGTANYRWLLLLDGQATCFDEHQNSYQLQPGDCFIRAPQTPHRVERIDDGRYLEYCITLPIPYWQSLCDLGLIASDQRFARLGLSDGLIDRCQRCFDHCRNDADPHERARLLQELNALLLLLIDDRPAIAAGMRQLVADCCRRLDQVDRPCSISGLAREAGVSADGLRTAFQRVIGCNPKAYRIRKRIEAAIELLRDPDRRLDEIADRLGYADAFAFSKQFKQQMGVSPSRFRSG